jgi:hypothetical protein
LKRFLINHWAFSRASKTFPRIANILFVLISAFAVVFVEVAILANYVAWIVRNATLSGRAVRDASSLQATPQVQLETVADRDGILNPTDITTLFQGKWL